MGENPFDACGPSEDRVSGGHHQSLQEAQDNIQSLLQTCEQKRQAHQEAWRQHKLKHHERRLEQALEREANEGRFIPPIVQEEWNARDDALFAHITEFDQLLELATHEEYLRARRAWDRRHKVEDIELNVEVHGYSVPSGSQIWAILVAIVVLIVFLSMLSQSFWAIALLPFAGVAWAVLSRLPGIYAGTFSGPGGARGASGNAV